MSTLQGNFGPKIWIISDKWLLKYKLVKNFIQNFVILLNVSEILTSSPNQGQGPWSLE